MSLKSLNHILIAFCDYLLSVVSQMMTYRTLAIIQIVRSSGGGEGSAKKTNNPYLTGNYSYSKSMQGVESQKLTNLSECIV